jgi:TonB family protein
MGTYILERRTANSKPLFLDLRKQPTERRWGAFAASYSVQAIALVALLFFTTMVAPKFENAPVKYVDLVAPELKPEPKLRAMPMRLLTKVVEPPPVITPVVPKIQPPVLQVRQPQRIRPVAPVAEIPQPRLAIATPKFDSKVLTALPGPKALSKVVAINTFGGSSATPTLPAKTAPAKVQTGGFGDPNGVPVNAHGSNRPNIASVGGFDLPAGGGHGNGTGGTSGMRGTVASAGFGNGVAVQGGGGRGGNAGQGRIQAAHFVNAIAASGPDPARQLRAINHPASSSPVSIQSKPTPAYTAEARQLRIEGEVLLNVVFTAQGQIRVLKVVRGLGHGLDEAAQRAAQGLKFSPAMQDGHPVDSNATLHIVFQLS